MECDDMFDELDQEIDWEAQFAAQSDELFAELLGDEAGDATIQKLENLFQVAEHQEAFANLQRMAAQLGDLCCNPLIASMMSSSDYLHSFVRPDEHAGCNDDHESDGTDSQKKKKKAARSLWAILFSNEFATSQSG